MARQVKHTETGELIDYKTAYRIQVGSRVCFYKSEGEYLVYKEKKEQKEELTKAFRRLWFSMMGGFNKDDYHAPMALAFSMIHEKYPYKFLLPRLKSAMDELDWVRDKPFGTGKAKLLYMLKVLTTGLENDIIEYEQTLTSEKNFNKKDEDRLFELSQQRIERKDNNSIDEFL